MRKYPLVAVEVLEGPIHLVSLVDHLQVPLGVLLRFGIAEEICVLFEEQGNSLPPQVHDPVVAQIVVDFDIARLNLHTGRVGPPVLVAGILGQLPDRGVSSARSAVIDRVVLLVGLVGAGHQDGVADEVDGNLVADQVPVALVNPDHADAGEEDHGRTAHEVVDLVRSAFHTHPGTGSRKLQPTMVGRTMVRVSLLGLRWTSICSARFLVKV